MVISHSIPDLMHSILNSLYLHCNEHMISCQEACMFLDDVLNGLENDYGQSFATSSKTLLAVL